MKTLVALALFVSVSCAEAAFAQATTPTCPVKDGTYYLHHSEWVSMDPVHAVGFKTTNVAGAAFSYGAAKARVKAQFRDAHSPYQLMGDSFAICLVGVTDSGRDITVAKFQDANCGSVRTPPMGALSLTPRQACSVRV